MKVLVTYFSQTGNTEQIANAIHQEVSQSNDATINKLEEINVDGLNDYDLIFLGSPIHAGGLSGAANEFLETLPESSKFKLSGFVTHSSPAYENESFERGVNSFDEAAKSKGINYLGCFDCQGRLTEALHDIVKQSRQLSDDEWAERMAQTDPHPDEEDEANAKKFAKEVLAKA